MGKKITKKQKLKKKLTYKFRLVVLNDDTLLEHFSMKLSVLNVFVFGSLFSILLVVSTTILIAFTSLREYIPGYASTGIKKNVTRMLYQTDSLKRRLILIENYTSAVKAVLEGNVEAQNIDSLINSNKKKEIDSKKLDASKQDSMFRDKIESRDRFPVHYDNVSEHKAQNIFFTPTSGTITAEFNPEKKHYAIDVAAQNGTVVKAIANGTVILSEWTADTGFIIAIQHTDDFVSVYKHNGSLLKNQGDQVESSEAIATVGSTGELTTGPHLHFELWNKGLPVNAKDYIHFE